MRLARRTYFLPPEVVNRFETEVKAGDRSSVVGKLLATWLAERDRKALRGQIVAGCKELAADYLEEDRAWNLAADDVWWRIDG